MFLNYKRLQLEYNISSEKKKKPEHFQKESKDSETREETEEDPREVGELAHDENPQKAGIVKEVNKISKYSNF